MSVIMLLLLTAIMWGVTPILEKVGLTRVEPLVGLTIRSVVVALLLVVFMLITGKTKEILAVDSRTFLIFALSGALAGLLGMLTYFAALKLGATSRIVPIAATYPLVTALLSVLILGENVTLIRLIGTVLIVLGIWLVK